MPLNAPLEKSYTIRGKDNILYKENYKYFTHFFIQDGATLEIHSTTTIYGDIQIDANGVIDISASKTLVHYGTLSGNGTIQGKGTYKLYGNVVD